MFPKFETWICCNCDLVKHSRSYDRRIYKQVSSHVPLCLTMTHPFRGSLNLGKTSFWWSAATHKCTHPQFLASDFNIHQNLHLNSDQFKILSLVPANPVAMSPSAEINQQPQAQEMMADQTAQHVVTSQPVRLHFQTKFCYLILFNSPGRRWLHSELDRKQYYGSEPRSEHAWRWNGRRLVRSAMLPICVYSLRFGINLDSWRNQFHSFEAICAFECCKGLCDCCC